MEVKGYVMVSMKKPSQLLKFALVHSGFVSVDHSTRHRAVCHQLFLAGIISSRHLGVGGEC